MRVVTTWLLFSFVLLGACAFNVARSVQTPRATRPSALLSALGVYRGTLAELNAESEYLAYDVNVSLFAGGAQKQRLLYLPKGAKLDTSRDPYRLPVGAILVKTFSYPTDLREPSARAHVVETRFLIQKEDGLQAAVYLWNDEQTEARASAGAIEVPVVWYDAQGGEHRQVHRVPGTSDCQKCHAGRALGLSTRQLARTAADGADQLPRLFEAGVLDVLPAAPTPLADPFGDQPLAWRARGYLDVNCGSCHSRDGSASDSDIYFDIEHTAPGRLPLCKDTWDIDGAEWTVAPGRPASSTTITRMLTTKKMFHMPRKSGKTADLAAVELLRTWIASMPFEQCK